MGHPEVKRGWAELLETAPLELPQRQPRSERSARSRRPGASQLAAALLGTLPVTLLAAALVGRAIPGDGELAFALGYFFAIPLWTFLTCRMLVAQSPGRAWTWCVVASVAAAVGLSLVPQPRSVDALQSSQSSSSER